MNEADSLHSNPLFFDHTEELDHNESLVPEIVDHGDRQLRRSMRDGSRHKRRRFGDPEPIDQSVTKSPAGRHVSRFVTSDGKEEKEIKKVVSVKPSMAPVTDIHTSYPDWSVLERELEAAKTHENAYFLDSSFLRALTVMGYWLSPEGPFFMPRREFRHRHCIFNLFWQPSAPNWEKSEYLVPPRLDGLLRWYLTRDNFIKYVQKLLTFPFWVARRFDLGPNAIGQILSKYGYQMLVLLEKSPYDALVPSFGLLGPEVRILDFRPPSPPCSSGEAKPVITAWIHPIGVPKPCSRFPCLQGNGVMDRRKRFCHSQIRLVSFPLPMSAPATSPSIIVYHIIFLSFSALFKFLTLCCSLHSQIDLYALPAHNFATPSNRLTTNSFSPILLANVTMVAMVALF